MEISRSARPADGISVFSSTAWAWSDRIFLMGRARAAAGGGAGRAPAKGTAAPSRRGIFLMCGRAQAGGASAANPQAAACAGSREQSAPASASSSSCSRLMTLADMLL